jgi:hypothetical protein
LCILLDYTYRNIFYNNFKAGLSKKRSSFDRKIQN